MRLLIFGETSPKSLRSNKLTVSISRQFTGSLTPKFVFEHGFAPVADTGVPELNGDKPCLQGTH